MQGKGEERTKALTGMSGKRVSLFRKIPPQIKYYSFMSVSPATSFHLKLRPRIKLHAAPNFGILCFV